MLPNATQLLHTSSPDYQSSSNLEDNSLSGLSNWLINLPEYPGSTAGNNLELFRPTPTFCAPSNVCALILFLYVSYLQADHECI